MQCWIYKISVSSFRNSFGKKTHKIKLQYLSAANTAVGSFTKLIHRWKLQGFIVFTLSAYFFYAIKTYCNVASRCLLGVDSSRLSSRFHLSLFALYSFFFCVSNAFRSCSCRPQISFCSFFSAVRFCFSYDKKNLHLPKKLFPTVSIQN